VVENKPGAGTNIANEYVAKAAPDGYTLLFTSPAHYINQNLYKNLTYDPVKDFIPVMRVSNTLLVLVVAQSAPVNSQAELIAYVRARPGQLSYSSAGSGSTTQLPAALFNSMANLDVIHIPYKSGAQALTDVIGGQVFMTFTAPATALPHLKAGTLKGIGVTGAARSQSMPNVPTIAEGGLPGYEFISWNGMLAPAGTPKEVTAKLEATLLKVAATPEFRQRLLSAGLEPEPLGAKAFSDRLQVEIPLWARVVKLSGAKVE
jgi:tripartite-type tricarboxylate transporter receptor subunit TctC